MRRLKENPLISRASVPASRSDLADVSSVFNPGAIKLNGHTLLLLRVQNRGRETLLVRATAPDGINFTLHPEPTEVTGLEALGRKVYHIYDPRITRIARQLYVTVSVDTDRGCYAVLTRTEDLTRLEYIATMGDSEARNGVLFPEQIGGRYLGLIRPNQQITGKTVLSGDEIRLVESTDLKNWQPVGSVMRGRLHYWDELIGSGPPPIKTREGWLHIYHGIATHFQSANVYQAGVCLLDLHDPSTVIARSRYNILEPRADYELVGQVPNVVFPTGLTVEEFDAEGFATPRGKVVVYYGAADTVVAAAEATVQELLDQCFAGTEGR